MQDSSGSSRRAEEVVGRCWYGNLQHLWRERSRLLLILGQASVARRPATQGTTCTAVLPTVAT